MQKATPRAQLHLQRVMEKSAHGAGDSVSAASDYAQGAAAAPSTSYPTDDKGGYTSVYNSSSGGRALTPLNNHRRASVMSINRDARSTSTAFPGKQNGNLSRSATPRDGGAADDHSYRNNSDPMNGHDDGDNSDPMNVHSEGDNSDQMNGHGEGDNSNPINPDGSDNDNEHINGDGHSSNPGSGVMDTHAANGTDADMHYGEDYAEEYTPRDPTDHYSAAAGLGTSATGAPSERSEDGAPMHANSDYRALSNNAERHNGSVERPRERSGTPQTIYDAEGSPICQVAFDESGNPVAVSYNEDGNPVYSGLEDIPLPAAVVRELLNQREETRRLIEERDAMQARLEELEGNSQSGGAGYVHTPRAGTSIRGYADTPENSVRNRDSHFLISLPEESAMNRGTNTPRAAAAGMSTPRGAAIGTPRSGPWAPSGGLTSANDENAIYYNPEAVYEHTEDVDIDETGARRRLVAEHDKAFLAILEDADASIEAQHGMALSFAHGSGAADGASAQRGISPPSTRALVAQEQIVVALQQEKEIGELRDSLAEAEEKIAKLEETNTALRLQLVLEKANRSK